MIYIVYLFSLATFFIGVLVIIKPVAMYDFISVHSHSPGIHVLAVFVRALIGAALLTCSTSAKFPVTFQIIGWASLVSALVTLLIGRTRFKNLVGWAADLSHTYKRMGGLLAVLFGGFLFYGVV